MDTVAELLRKGIDALQAGDKATANDLLSRATQLDPENEQAWLWLSGVVPSPAEQRYCYEQVLRINPQNASAWRGLAALSSPVPPVETKSPPGKPHLVTTDPIPPARPVERGGFASAVLIVSLVVACVLVPLSVRNKARSSGATTYTPDRIGAYVACEDFVTKRLKAPSSADFGSSLDADITNLGSDRWTVVSYVDAENPFGAQLRMNFVCTVRYTGNEFWALENLVTDP